MACPLATERVWLDKSKYNDAEKDYFEHLSKLLKGAGSKENVSKRESTPTKVVTDSATAKVKKNKKTKAHNQASESAAAVLPPNGVNEAENTSEVSLSIDIKPNEAEKKDNLKSEEAKTKKKKKKNSNKDNSEKLQEGNRKEPEDPDKEDSLKRQKSNFKLKAPTSQCTLVSEIAKARQHIKNSLERMDGIAALAASPITAGSDVLERLAALEKENATLKELVESLKKCCLDTNNRVQTLEKRLQTLTVQQPQSVPKTVAPPKKEEKPKVDNNDDDDGVDLFASDSEDDEEANAVREQRLADYHAKKSKKPALIAKSSVVLDIKPWDDTTDLKKMEEEIRKIETDGLLWGASKQQPVAFGIKKLVLSCVVEDEKVSIDWLTEEIEKLEDYVQSVDVAAFNKI